MQRSVTLFTGQWADLPISAMAEKAAGFGFDGLELACWGDHFEVSKAAGEGGEEYCRSIRELLAGHGLGCWAISNHLVGQAVCDPIDARHESILPGSVWGDGEAEGVRARAAEEMKRTVRAAARLGVGVVNGFTGSSIWHKLYFFPPTSDAEIGAGFDDFAAKWGPILDVCKEVGVRFALEVHPTEIAYDIHTAARALEAIGHHESFGFNFDPSHLIWQGIDPARFIDRFPDRIFHVHMKDAATRLDGESSILSSHLAFGDARRGWDFRSVGRGDVNFEEIIRSLNRAGYAGPLSVEWEDSAMDREYGAAESCEFTRALDFPSNARAFDASFESDEQADGAKTR